MSALLKNVVGDSVVSQQLDPSTLAQVAFKVLLLPHHSEPLVCELWELLAVSSTHCGGTFDL